jgi:hypothetical protein
MGRIVVIVVSADTLAAPHEMTAIRIQAHSGTSQGRQEGSDKKKKHVRVVTVNV